MAHAAPSLADTVMSCCDVYQHSCQPRPWHRRHHQPFATEQSLRRDGRAAGAGETWLSFLLHHLQEGGTDTVFPPPPHRQFTGYRRVPVPRLALQSFSAGSRSERRPFSFRAQGHRQLCLRLKGTPDGENWVQSPPVSRPHQSRLPHSSLRGAGYTEGSRLPGLETAPASRCPWDGDVRTRVWNYGKGPSPSS